jgi:hypothetical protein
VSGYRCDPNGDNECAPDEQFLVGAAPGAGAVRPEAGSSEDGAGDA